MTAPCTLHHVVVTQISGGEAFVEAAVDMLRRRCLHQISSNVSLYSDDDPDVSDAMNLVEQQLCFDECHPHGRCQHGGYVTSSSQ